MRFSFPASRSSFTAGIGLLSASVILAFAFEFKHFYELLLLGQLLILLPLAKPQLSLRFLIILYASFTALGLFADFILALNLTNLWRYHYTALWEYFLLYLLIYPVAGFVMLFSYWAARDRLNFKSLTSTSKKSQLLSLQVTGLLSFLAIISFFWLLLFGDTLNQALVNTLFFIFVAIFGFFAVSFLTELRNSPSLVRHFLENPFKIGLAVFAVTYLNLILHEYPNLFAGQWQYFILTNTFLDNRLLSLPFIIWLAWPALLLAPLSTCYLLKSFVDKNSPKLS